MRQLRPRRVALLSLITAGMIGSILIPWAAQRASAASDGGTSASVNGDTVTIAVNIDICCGGTSRDPANFDSLVRDDVKQAEAAWNQALSRLPYKGCFSIHVAFSVHILTGPESEDGYHYLYVEPSEPGRSYVHGPPVGEDNTWVYLNVVGQSELFLASMSIATWEHEIGHLMGLQDDYQDQVVGGATVSVALPGRAGTLMDTGSSIDQNLANRIGDLAAKSGLKLPSCWKGTITSTSARQFFEGGQNSTCSDAWTGTLSFTVDGQNAVTGSGALNRNGAVACTNPGLEPGQPGVPPPTQTYTFSVSGVRTTAGFTLQFNITSIVPPHPSSIDVAGIWSLLETSACPYKPGVKLSIPFDRPNHASGVIVLDATIVHGCSSNPGGSQNDIFSSTSTIGLTGP
jgi:hypothetical protein